MWLSHRGKRLSHEARVLRYLKKKGRHGAFNHQLAHPEIGGLSWHRRIGNLRSEGHNIIRVHLKGGVWKYYYVKSDD